MLDCIVNASAATRLASIGMLLAGVTMYMQQHVASLQRADFRRQEYFEDSKNGTGTRYRVITRAADSAGSYTELEFLVRPTAVGFNPNYPGSTPYHSHPEQEETFQVVEGVFAYNLEGKIGNATAGQVVTIPQGAKHSMWCGSDQPMLLRVTLTPAGRMGEAFFENLAGLGATYGDVSKIHPLQLTVLFEAGAVRFEGIPGLMSWGLSNVLAPFARLLGFKASYPQYVSAGTAAAAVASS